MTVEFVRRTVAHPIDFEGFGLHSGEPVQVRIEPGRRGVWFSAGKHSVQAKPEEVTDTTRCTRLGAVSTVEHLLSAFAGVGVTDAEVVLSYPEVPALDGSSRPFAEAIIAAGLQEVGRATVSLFERVFFVEDPVRVAIAQGSGEWRYTYDASPRWPGAQSIEVTISQATYREHIAPARTFANEEDVDALRAAGLGLGLDLESALILGKDEYKNTPRFDNEPARHKLLDLIGDLSLAGVPPTLLSVVAERSGHRTNVAAAARLAQHARIERV